MTGTGTLFSLGNPSKSTVLAEEEFKIRVEFTTAADVKRGQLVKLTAAGLITPWAKTDLQHLCIGYCDADILSGALATVVTRGYAIIYALSAGAVNAGMGTYNSYDTTDADTTFGAKGYNVWGVATDVTDCVGWILDQATLANQLMRVLVKD